MQDFEWGRLYFYAFILTYGASLLNKKLADNLADELLPAVGLRGLYDEALPETTRFFEPCPTFADLTTKAIDEGVAPPFADVGSSRKLSWQQLGIQWNVGWENDYQTTVLAESFIAQLQILLTDLRKIDLSLFLADVDLTVKLHSGKLRIDEIPSNERVIRDIFFPKEGMAPELVFGVAGTILKVVSAHPHDRFLAIIQGRMEQGLLQKTNPHAPYDVLFREFYLEEDYEVLHKLGASIELKIPKFVIATAKGLDGPSGIHKDYGQRESHRAIESRYRRSPGLLRLTLPRLVEDEAFRSAVEVLRTEGWKDWHILLAVGGVRLNFVVNQILPPSASPDDHKKVLQGLLERDEIESDPAPPTDIFTLEKLRFSLKLSQISTLKGMGFECWQQTPVTDAVDAFLRRFNYWTDDVPHKDPFVAGE